MDISHAQRGPWSPGRRVPHKVAILPERLPSPLETTFFAHDVPHAIAPSRAAVLQRAEVARASGGGRTSAARAQALLLGLIRGDCSRSAPPDAEGAHQGAGNRGAKQRPLSSLFSFQDTETHRQQAPHGCISHHTKRSPERAPSTTTRRWAPRQLFPPRAARACCAGRCLASYIYYTPCGSPRKHQI